MRFSRHRESAAHEIGEDATHLVRPHDDHEHAGECHRGDYSETYSNGGPNFQLRDVNTTNDLHLTGEVPDTIDVGTKVHVIARVGSFKDPLFQLEPVQTSLR